MKKPLKTLIVLLALALIGCTQQPAGPQNSPTPTETGLSEVEATAPDAETKTAQGYALPGLAHGLCQSPINIDTQSLKADGQHKITLNFQDKVNKVENLGHTVQLDFEAGSTITADGLTFDFKQCHFHTPSEHLIDGMTFPMELHIVNIAPKTTDDETQQYMVIGVLFKEGKENKFIAEFLNAIPKEANTSTELKANQVRLGDLFAAAPSDLIKRHYFYKGSLTTPPFTESVRWHISEVIFEASAEQIKAINKIEGNNARHVQALYGRSVQEE
jgi:carbonic anhydrase